MQSFDIELALINEMSSREKNVFGEVNIQSLNFHWNQIINSMPRNALVYANGTTCAKCSAKVLRAIVDTGKFFSKLN